MAPKQEHQQQHVGIHHSYNSQMSFVSSSSSSDNDEDVGTAITTTSLETDTNSIESTPFLMKKNRNMTTTTTTTKKVVLFKEHHHRTPKYWLLEQYKNKPCSLFIVTIIVVLTCIIMTVSPTIKKSFHTWTESSSSESVARKKQSCPVHPKPKEEPLLPGKKGIGFIEILQGMQNISLVEPHWNFNWGLIRNRAEPNDIPFIPMTWTGEDSVSKFQQRIQDSQIQQLINNNTIQLLMGFNEPDHKYQANMLVQDAINRWPILQSLNVPLVSPSCIHPNSPWMIEFMKVAIDNCYRIDYIGVHYYGTADFGAFQLDMENFYNLYQKPLFITEFAPADWIAATKEENRYSLTDVLRFAKQALPWLEQTSWIIGYAWYSFEPDSVVGWTSSLFDINGTLTPLGQYYKSVSSNNIYGNQSIEY